MKPYRILLTALTLLFILSPIRILAQSGDIEGARDPALFPRPAGYFISLYEPKDEDVQEFYVKRFDRYMKAGGATEIIDYQINSESKIKASIVGVLKHYSTILKNLKFQNEYEDQPYGKLNGRGEAGGKVYWLKIEVYDEGKGYKLTLVNHPQGSLPYSEADFNGSSDHRLFTRFPNYYISEFDEKDFDQDEFWRKSLDRYEKVEGKKTVIGYRIKPELYVKHNSAVEIIKNYINAGKTLKASVEYEDYTFNQAVMKIVSNRNEVWVKLEVAEDGKAYKLTILEREALTPTITAGELKTALDRDGKVALYINFEIGSDVIPADAEAAFTEVVSLLKQNPSYKLSIEGHTDNTGEVSGNQKLSDMRAQSVLKELVKRGIAATRLSAKGFGRTKPIADNSTEEGRAKNRRVELVKMK